MRSEEKKKILEQNYFNILQKKKKRSHDINLRSCVILITSMKNQFLKLLKQMARASPLLPKRIKGK